MPAFDLQSLTAPVAPEDPCGPDFDLAGDGDYLNLMAGAESKLPSSYFDGKDDSGGLGRPFQFSRQDLDSLVQGATPLLAKTRDLRLLILLAKYSLLGRELLDFITLLRAVAALLSERWDEVHPRAEDGEFLARAAAVESIEAQATIIMPLQFAPLIEHRRHGSISYRNHLIATGTVQARENEPVIDQTTIGKAIEETQVAVLVARRDEFIGLQQALEGICRTWAERIGSGESIRLDKATEIVGRIVAFLDAAVTSHDPSAGLVAPKPLDAADDAVQEAGGGEAAAPVGRVTNAREAAAALGAVADYFSRQEPSSPTLLLVRQASQLLGKPFLEVMRTLVPTYVEHAAIHIGRTESFALPIERLSAAGGGVGVEVPAPNGSNGADAADTLFEVRSRGQALALLDQVGSYFRGAEPSSPIPFLIERARDLAQRDFLSVLKALLPADTLKPNGS